MHFTHTGDYRSRYSGTYIGVPTDDGIRPLYVRDIEGRGRNTSFVGQYVREDGSKEDTLSTVNVRQEGLLLAPPKLGLVADRGSLCYMYRKPHRRWKQGLSLDSTYPRWFVRDVNGEGLNVFRIFNQQFTALDEALQEASTINRRGYMITRYVGVVSSEREGHCHVVFRADKVGDYNSESDTLVLLPEYGALQDPMIRSGFNNVQIGD